jgi:hypothetical protein
MKDINGTLTEKANHYFVEFVEKFQEKQVKSQPWNRNIAH